MSGRWEDDCYCPGWLGGDCDYLTSGGPDDDLLEYLEGGRDSPPRDYDNEDWLDRLMGQWAEDRNGDLEV